MILWTAQEIARATSGKAAGDWSITGIAIDSRAVQPGDLFIALVGPNNDAHAYVAQALASGAAGALVHRMPEGAATDKLIIVEDTFAALGALGKAGRDRFGGKVVAVTGSVGKTSTKEMLALGLAASGTTHAAVGSFNNHWGVPLTLARMPRDAAFAVIEIGMNHPGEITPLVKMARPHAAIVTTVAAAHLEFFNSVEEIADAKAEIFLGVEKDGTALLPRDSEHFARLLSHAHQSGLNIVTFGSHAEADIRLLDVAVDADKTICFAAIDGEQVSYTIGAGGRHWADNGLAVVGAVRAVGANIEDAVQALADMVPPQGRGRRHRVPLAHGDFTLVDESYNANPASTAAAIAALGSAQPAVGGRRIAVLGDMLELGDRGPALHADLAHQMSSARVDLVFTCGLLTSHLHDALPPGLRGAHADNSEALAPVVVAAVRSGDVVMIKGSLGSRMSRIVQTLLECRPAEPARRTANGD